MKRTHAPSLHASGRVSTADSNIFLFNLHSTLHSLSPHTHTCVRVSPSVLPNILSFSKCLQSFGSGTPNFQTCWLSSIPISGVWKCSKCVIFVKYVQCVKCVKSMKLFHIGSTCRTCEVCRVCNLFEECTV